MRVGDRCPKCAGNVLTLDKNTKSLSCYSCGYEEGPILVQVAKQIIAQQDGMLPQCLQTTKTALKDALDKALAGENPEDGYWETWIEAADPESLCAIITEWVNRVPQQDSRGLLYLKNYLEAMIECDPGKRHE